MTPVTATQERESIHLLAIESSGITCGVAVSRDEQVLGEISLNIKNVHSEKLAPLIKGLLETLSMTVEELKGIVLSAGPGSFTGLRIGYSVAKGMAAALQIPIVEVPTLDVWAYQAGEQSLPVLPVIDAHRGELFCAQYRWKENELKMEVEYALLSPEALRQHIIEPVAVTGADAPQLFSRIAPFLPKGSCLLPSTAPYLLVWPLATLGYGKFRKGEFADASQCEPFYLRAFKGVS